VPYGIARVIQNGTFSLEGDTIELFGGSNRYAWQAEDGDINATLAFSVSEYPNWLFQLFGGKAPTQNAPETSGNIATPENINGVSMFDSVLGVASIAVSTAANLKFTKYTLEATAVDGFKLYAGSDVDFGRGAPTGFFDDSLLIAEFSSVGSSGVLTLTTLGLEITMGSAIDMCVCFVTRKSNGTHDDTSEIQVGSTRIWAIDSLFLCSPKSLFVQAGTLAALKFSSACSQLTTFHQAEMYSGRRF